MPKKFLLDTSRKGPFALPGSGEGFGSFASSGDIASDSSDDNRIKYLAHIPASVVWA